MLRGGCRRILLCGCPALNWLAEPPKGNRAIPLRSGAKCGGQPGDDPSLTRHWADHYRAHLPEPKIADQLRGQSQSWPSPCGDGIQTSDHRIARGARPRLVRGSCLDGVAPGHSELEAAAELPKHGVRLVCGGNWYHCGIAAAGHGNVTGLSEEAWHGQLLDVQCRVRDEEKGDGADEDRRSHVG